MRPTDEQQFAIDLAVKGDDLKLAAFAGAGKTTTLKLIANAMEGKRGIYLAFNKAIVNSLDGKLPANVEAKTFHSLAYRQFGVPIKHKLERRLTGQYVARRLGIESTSIETEAGTVRPIMASTIGYYVMQCAQAYARWDGKEMPIKAYPYPDMRGLSKGQMAAFRQQYAPLAIRLWHMMSNPDDECPATHDVYVKQWVDSRPRVKADFLLFDEAQDADPLMIRLVQSQDHAQKIWVGDAYQSIYTWRGAINAMDRIEARTAYLTQSFRFGQEVADRAQIILWTLGCQQRLRGFEQRESAIRKLDEYDAIIFRTNASVVEHLLDLYERGKGEGVSATGVDQAMRRIRAIASLREGKNPGGEFALFKDYSELVEYANTPSGGDMLPAIRIEKEYGADRVESMLAKAQATRSPRLVLSVGHQAKGLEWSRVKIGHDFLTPPTAAECRQALEEGGRPPREPSEEENRLLYVCLTRAIDVLDDTAIDYYGYFERIGDLPPPKGRETASALEEAEAILDNAPSIEREELVSKVEKAIADVASPERRKVLAKVATDIALRRHDEFTAYRQ